MIYRNPLTGRSSGIQFQRGSQDSLHVPQAAPFDPFNQVDDGLHVPNQLPLNATGTYGYPGMSKDYFTCPDGTVINIKTRKVVMDASKGHGNGYWGDRMMDQSMSIQEQEWRDQDIYRNPFAYVGGNGIDQGLSQKDIEYNRIRAQKDAELRNNMTDLQRKLLSQIDNGVINSRSRLVEER